MFLSFFFLSWYEALALFRELIRKPGTHTFIFLSRLVCGIVVLSRVQYVWRFAFTLISSRFVCKARFISLVLCDHIVNNFEAFWCSSQGRGKIISAGTG